MGETRDVCCLEGSRNLSAHAVQTSRCDALKSGKSFQYKMFQKYRNPVEGKSVECDMQRKYES
jgi:hypothetical protein